MKRMPIVLVLSLVLGGGGLLAQAASAQAQTQTPPPKPTPPPAIVPPPSTGGAAQMPAAPAAKPPTPFPAGAMVAYIDLQRIVNESKLGKSGTEAMKSLSEKLDAALAAKNQEIKALSDKASAQASLASDVTKQGWAKDLDRLNREAQFMSQDADVQKQQRQAELLDDFNRKVIPLIEEVRAEKGLWMVFVVGEQSNIAAAHAGLDLSLDVVKRLDTKYPK